MNKIFLHIPHSSKRLPYWFFKKILISEEELNSFNNKITDLYVDKLFSAKKYKNLKAKYSRVFCDVEKFADEEKEEMSKHGMGFIYTHTTSAMKFFNPSAQYKDKVYNRYYLKHHDRLDKNVAKLIKRGKVVLIDCHSFCKEIIMDKEKQEDLPDVCIGFDKLYYSRKLVNYIKSYFEMLGYRVNLNYPYSGTMIPSKFIKEKVDNLYSVMIEINKQIYIDEKNKKNKNFEILKNQINLLIDKVKVLQL